MACVPQTSMSALIRIDNYPILKYTIEKFLILRFVVLNYFLALVCGNKTGKMISRPVFHVRFYKQNTQGMLKVNTTFKMAKDDKIKVSTEIILSINKNLQTIFV